MTRPLDSLIDVQRSLAQRVSESLIPREAADRADAFVTERICAAFRAAGWLPATELLEALRALHPMIEHPRYGCCARPAACSPDWASAFGKSHGAYRALRPAQHPAVCGGKDHGLNRPRWPCPTMAAVIASESVQTQKGAGNGKG